MIPNTAEKRIITTGCIFFASKNNMIPKISKDDAVPKLFMLSQLTPEIKNTDLPTETIAAPIMPITAGFNPFMQPMTYLFLLKLAKNFAIISIIINDGKITPKVAHNAPKNPPI